MISQRIDTYLAFAEAHPHLFVNDPSPNAIRIILDKEILREQQKMLYDMADKKHHPRNWVDIGIVAEDRYMVVLRDLVLFPNGTYGGYIRKLNRISEVFLQGHDTVIVPIIQNQFLLLHHYRHESRRWSIEFPRGFGEAGLTAEENAIKELSEEVGLTASAIENIGGKCARGNHANVEYFAIWINTSTVKIEVDEGIDQYQLVSREKLEKMISDGEIFDSYTIQAYAYATLQTWWSNL